MGTEFVTDEVWDRLTEASKSARKPAHVAVAYLGKGGAALLRLPSGSTLVVDVSEPVVKAGQTHPNDLLELAEGGVSIFSCAGLHAKVFCFDGKAFVGSTNVSKNSKDNLQEAVVEIEDPKVLKAIRSFVSDMAIEPVGPDELKRLQGLYRPPKLPNNKLAAPGDLRVFSTSDLDLPPGGYQEAMDKGEAEASKAAQSGFAIASFWWSSPAPCSAGDLIVQVYKTGRGRIVSPPGKVQRVKRFTGAKGPRTFVYYEVPSNGDWPSLSSFPKSVQALLRRGGLRSAESARRIQEAWALKSRAAKK